jgi:Nucleotidyl transferase AbiEii toxin, Type IV TA system
MTVKGVKNPAASVRERLFFHAKQRGDDYQRILTRYAIERLLFRIGHTEAVERFVLKGAMLFATWPAHVYRSTGDVDLLGYGAPDPEAITEIFTRICQVEVPADGIVFDPERLTIAAVRETEKYPGIRLTVKGQLAGALIHVQVDIGFGDHVYPSPKRQTFPCLLTELPAPQLLMYPRESVIAEKFEAMLRLGETNGRLKDFHDMWAATRAFSFDLSTLVESVGGTLRRRETAIPTEMPIGLTEGFAMIAERRWSGFLRRSPPTLPPPPLADLLGELRRFFRPVIVGLTAPEAAKGRWDPASRAWGWQ